MSKVVQIHSFKDYEEFKNTNERGVIFYSAKKCDACRDIEPLYARVANRYHKRVAMAYADVDECNLNFKVIPVFVSFFQGEPLNRMEGVSAANLKLFIKEVIEAK